MLLLPNCDCRTQTIVCTTWKSGPSRQSKSAIFSTPAQNTFESEAQTLHVCTSFTIRMGVKMPFAAVVYTSHSLLLNDQQDRHTISGRKIYPLLHCTFFPLRLSSFPSHIVEVSFQAPSYPKALSPFLVFLSLSCYFLPFPQILLFLPLSSPFVICLLLPFPPI